jgi:hypothetical protein
VRGRKPDLTVGWPAASNILRATMGESDADLRVGTAISADIIVGKTLGADKNVGSLRPRNRS